MLAANRNVRDGIVVGLIGYAGVAVFYSGFDLLAARGLLYTVDLLGKAVFAGLRDPGAINFPLQLDWTAIMQYNALHFVLAMAIGQVVTGLVGQAERKPSQRFAVIFVIVAGFVVTVLGVGRLTSDMRPFLPWWSIVVANGLASLMAAAYLLRRRPGLWRLLIVGREPH
ncbi:MAG: hypothetical protein AABZ80_05950 [Gemmatimonadota bacterium]